jgi:hypothetical protein
MIDAAVPPSANRARGALRALPLLCLLFGGVAAAADRVQAQLSAREIASGQPVELRLTAQGETAEGPDLSVLEPDFRILDRRIERHFAIRNGQRDEQVRLILLLLPLREGTLQVPSIPVGNLRTEPLALTVRPDPGAPAGASTAAGPMPFSGPGLLPVPVVPITPPTAPAPSTPAPAGGTNTWFWVSMGLAGMLAAVLASRRRTPSPAAPPPAASPQAPGDTAPTDPALDRVAAAYQAGDAGAARAALLAWGAARWPTDPPANLARLASRCPPTLRGAINHLEMAFFSPTPIPWDREPVADELARMTQGEGQGSSG